MTHNLFYYSMTPFLSEIKNIFFFPFSSQNPKRQKVPKGNRRQCVDDYRYPDGVKFFCFFFFLFISPPSRLTDGAEL